MQQPEEHKWSMITQCFVSDYFKSSLSEENQTKLFSSIFKENITDI